MRRLLDRLKSAWRGSSGLAATQETAAAAPRRRAGYAEWVARYGTIGEPERLRLRQMVAGLPQHPLVSLLLIRRGGDELAFAATLASLQAQVYQDWELCLVTAEDAGGSAAAVQTDDPRIRPALAPVAGSLSPFSRALHQARGALITMIEAGDCLSPAALLAVVQAFSERDAAVAVYTDEDRIDAAGRRIDPWFKGAWNLDLFLAQAYALRLGVLRRTALAELPATVPGAEFFNLWLRATAAAAPEQVLHLPWVLYHRRADAPGSEPSACLDAARRHVESVAPGASVEALPRHGWRHVVWPIPSPAPRISLCIPTRDRVALLSTCVEGLRHRTDWPDLEIIIMDNGSEDAATLDYLASLAGDARVRILREAGPFNFSRLNNLGAKAATGVLFGLLNNDLDVQDPGWLREMASHALRPEVGAVGALLHYGDDTVQHAGVVLGIGGVASHIHKRLPAGESGYQGRVAVAQEVAGVSAACLLTRLSVYRELGGLNEHDLPVAYNDVDFCLRLRERGLRIVFTPHARLYHLESATRGLDDRGERRARLDRDKAWMLQRWNGALAADPFYSPNLSLAATDCRLAWPPRRPPPWIAQD